MAGKPEYRNVPIREDLRVPARLMGVCENYAMVRRSGAMPFVITDRAWQESPRCTPEGIPMNRSSTNAG